MQLSIDTSTDTAGLVLVRDGYILAELTWRCGQNHTRQLMPNLEHLLHQLELNPAEITGIIVARGPGSFNGLRVGISAAKGLAFSLDVPIVGISSLEAEAYQHAETGLHITKQERGYWEWGGVAHTDGYAIGESWGMGSVSAPTGR